MLHQTNFRCFFPPFLNTILPSVSCWIHRFFSFVYANTFIMFDALAYKSSFSMTFNASILFIFISCSSHIFTLHGWWYFSFMSVFFTFWFVFFFVLVLCLDWFDQFQVNISFCLTYCFTFLLKYYQFVVFLLQRILYAYKSMALLIQISYRHRFTFFAFFFAKTQKIFALIIRSNIVLYINAIDSERMLMLSTLFFFLY